MNKKATLILEYVWLTISIISAVGGSIKFYRLGFDKSYVFYIIAAISAFMYILRRSMRKLDENKK
jgi:hypothetical protein